MDKGWIKLHRKLTEKAIWIESTPIQKTILITLLLMANHNEKEWEWNGKKYETQPGQFVTSLNSIAQKCGKGVSIQNVRTSLLRFEKYGFLTNKSTNKNRMITIENWGYYQDEKKEVTNDLTGNQQATNKQLTTNKNVRMKECKNNNKNILHRFETCDMNLAELLFEKILENNPNHKKPNLDAWANDMRLMRERDDRTVEQIEYLIKWSQAHAFWHTNILSPTKLRKQFDKLILQVKQEKSSKVTPITEARKDKYNYDLGF